MKKFNTFSMFLLVILVGCTSTNVASNNITGQDIKQQYNKLQNFIYSFENEEQVIFNRNYGGSFIFIQRKRKDRSAG